MAPNETGVFAIQNVAEVHSHHSVDVFVCVCVSQRMAETNANESSATEISDRQQTAECRSDAVRVWDMKRCLNC